jgi:hypothetical protein
MSSPPPFSESRCSRIFNEAIGMIGAQPERSIRTLTNVTDLKFNAAAADANE